jgi:hypothetical protein
MFDAEAFRDEDVQVLLQLRVVEIRRVHEVRPPRGVIVTQSEQCGDELEPASITE